MQTFKLYLHFFPAYGTFGLWGALLAGGETVVSNRTFRDVRWVADYFKWTYIWRTKKLKQDLDTYVYILLNKSTFVCHSSWLSIIICFVRGPSRRNILPISKSGVSLYLNTNIISRIFAKHLLIHLCQTLFHNWTNIFYIIILFYNCTWTQTGFIFDQKDLLYLNPDIIS